MVSCWSACLIVVVVAAAVPAQSIYVDLDVAIGNAHGPPSDQFGGAPGISGRWNAVDSTASYSGKLLDSAGQTTDVYITATNTGSGGGGATGRNSGDYSLLLDDFANIPDHMAYSFHNLRPGAYIVYTYAVNTLGRTIPVDVFIEGAIDPNPQRITGPMPGNRFEYLVTHSKHYVPSLRGDLLIDLTGAWPYAEVNGFQVIAVVPEPSALVVFLSGVAWLGRRRNSTTRPAN